jgi:hypothetical protein
MDRFPSALQQMAPSSGTQGSALRGVMNFSQNFGGGRGPLDADNWQSSRVTALNIRNVPGSNVFMTAAGMTG